MELVGDSANMPVRPAGCDHHEVTDGRLSPQIDRHHVLGFGLVEPGRCPWRAEQPACVGRQKLGGRRALSSTLKCGSHRVLVVLLSFTPVGLSLDVLAVAGSIGACCGRRTPPLPKQKISGVPRPHQYPCAGAVSEAVPCIEKICSTSAAYPAFAVRRAVEDASDSRLLRKTHAGGFRSASSGAANSGRRRRAR